MSPNGSAEGGFEVAYRCATCESEHDNIWDVLACYRSHSLTLAVETVAKGEPDWDEGGVEGE